MSRTTAPETLAAIQRIMAGEDVTTVARAMQLNRSTLHRRMKAMGLVSPVKGRRGRPVKSV